MGMLSNNVSVIRSILLAGLVSVGGGCAMLGQHSQQSDLSAATTSSAADMLETTSDHAISNKVAKTPDRVYANQIAMAELLGRLLHEETSSDAGLSPDAESIRAIGMVDNANYKTCTRPYRTVATYLGNENEGTRTTYIYKLSSPVDSSILSLGVHHRFEVSPTQFQPSELVSYTSNCLEVAPEPNTYAISMTHSRKPYPEDIHVWLSLENDLTVYVTTKENNAYWVIKDGAISWLSVPTKEQRALLGLPDIADAAPPQS